MTTPLKVDKKVCTGSGLCAAMHPHLFRLTDDGRGEAVRLELSDPNDIEYAQDVANCCPSGAVVVLDPAG